MITDRVNELLEYLNVLSQVQGSGHYVNEEIKEVVKEIRLELGLEKKKQDTLKESRKLVFEAKLGGKTTFTQQALFEAVLGSSERVIELPYMRGTGASEGAITLVGMLPNVYLITHPQEATREKNNRILASNTSFRGRFRSGDIIIIDFLGVDVEIKFEEFPEGVRFVKLKGVE